MRLVFSKVLFKLLKRVVTFEQTKILSLFSLVFRLMMLTAHISIMYSLKGSQKELKDGGVSNLFIKILLLYISVND